MVSGAVVFRVHFGTCTLYFRASFPQDLYRVFPTALVQFGMISLTL